MQKKFRSKSACVEFFNSFTKVFIPGDIIFFNGDLGVGKTFFAKQIIMNLTGDIFVTSPTFNLVNTYLTRNGIEVWHCDFFRLSDISEIQELGVFDDMYKKIIILEWPKFVRKFSIDPIVIEVKFGKTTYERILNLKFSKNWNYRLEFLKNKS